MARILLASLLLLTCGSSTPRTDGGVIVDTSCGIDCDAQRFFGLIAGRCLAYSTSPTRADVPPAMGAVVKPVFSLEGNVPVMQVEYREGGQIKMIDSFAFPNGDLQLMRREWPQAGQSVSYKNDSMRITGVKWLQPGTENGAFVSASSADVILNRMAMRETRTVSYRATAATASATDSRTPFATLDGGITLLVGETPDNGSDPRRLFVPSLGFGVIATSLQFSGGTAQPRYLQAVYEPGADGGADCSL
jgi:hypothetical protein